MNILFLSFHYQPDLSACSFRSSALVSALCSRLPQGSHIDVITTAPNRYASFSVDAPATEEKSQVRVTRIELPGHNNGMLDQSRAFLTYANAVRKHIKVREYDMVYASSSRLMTASLAALIAQKRKIPLYLDMRDIFVDTISDVISSSFTWFLKPIFSRIERWIMSKATRVNLVSRGFHEYFSSRYPLLRFSFFTNGVDDDFVKSQPLVSTSATNNEVLVVYAGNMGEGQGLHRILPKLAKRLEGRARFELYGDGGRRIQLQEALEWNRVTNVVLHDPVPRAQLIDVYRSADVLFMHLNRYEAFLKVLPSKLFEYAAMGKPILAGVSGYPAQFIHEYVVNAAVFDPCDSEQAVNCFESLTLTTQPRFEFVSAYARKEIMANMAVDVLSVMNKEF